MIKLALTQLNIEMQVRIQLIITQDPMCDTKSTKEKRTRPKSRVCLAP